MKIKSKYKIARRLGGEVFEKTQTQKFALKFGAKKIVRGRGERSEYGKALLEKQKARFTYLMNERQFKNYANVAIAEHKKKPDEKLYDMLEGRLDNVVCRLGLTTTRLAARQVVSHGHIAVDGKRVTVPSCQVSVGEVISVMPRSHKSKLFVNVAERAKEYNAPSWLSFDPAKLEGKMISLPKLSPSELHFDINVILDFYKR